MAQFDKYDAVVIGGGFFGCSLALEIKNYFRKVILIESESELLQRASYSNQARIHNGYHYPRHFLTALRSHVNFPRFVYDFKNCVESDFEKYYAISRRFSKTTASQFKSFFERVGAPVEQSPTTIKKLFNLDMVEDVFTVREFAFNALQLKDEMADRLMNAKIEVQLESRALQISQDEGDFSRILIRNGRQVERWLKTKHVFNCTYANINEILSNSGLPIIPVKHEITVMCLIDLPEVLRKKSITVMCGPFFSFMPFKRSRFKFFIKFHSN